jgi:hypothetical protein
MYPRGRLHGIQPLLAGDAEAGKVEDFEFPEAPRCAATSAKVRARSCR